MIYTLEEISTGEYDYEILSALKTDANNLIISGHDKDTMFRISTYILSDHNSDNFSFRFPQC
jgi:hypothetical protein